MSDPAVIISESRESIIMLDKSFFLAGRATFTVEPTLEFCQSHGIPQHFTFRVSRKSDKHPHFAYLLTGPDNGSDYTYIGMVDPSYPKALLLTKKSKFTDDTWAVKILRRVLIRIFAGEGDAISAAGWNVMHDGRCAKCSRLLTDPESIRCGLGPRCRGKR